MHSPYTSKFKLVLFRYHEYGSKKLNVYFTHGLFLTCTPKSRYIYKSFIAIFTRHTAFPPNPTPCIIDKTTPLYLLGEQVSLLVVMNTHPPLSLVCQQLPHPLAFAPLTLSHPTVQLHYLHRQHQQTWLSLSGTSMYCNKSVL
jgi:hypothetical protein